MKNIFGEMAVLFSYPQHFIMLFARLLLAYGFVHPSLLKLHDIEATSQWFETMHIPLPQLLSYLVVGIEVLGIILLILGLFTRYISMLLFLVMLGAIFFVHLHNGFSVGNNGIEIPLYYLLFFMIFSTFGAGKYSLDSVIFKDKNHE
ncbi:probable integral membrane protein NMA0226 [hydrothermal vent metagenome]|uniref:Probable integral membrane protein NMA0226 n=1 Tax=hydrothermal vent metagenome TaxID=652676 RepID=A0A1W1CVM0_9ZZZZ